MDKVDRPLDRNRLAEFPALKDNVYLDHAGTTLASCSQLDGFRGDIVGNLYGNPHSHSPSSQLTTDAIDQVRYRVLQFFNTSPEEYSVVFTSGCTASLKLIAELFDFQGNECCHGDQPCHKDSCQISENTSDQMTNTQHVIHQLHNIPEIPQNTNDQSGASLLESQNQVKGQIVDMFKGSRTESQGSFTYLIDNHTSVQGMRQLALSRAGQVNCIGCDCHGNTLDAKVMVLFQHTDFQYSGNNLFAYPAQSNYSGWKYPLEWISWIKNSKMRWQRSWEGQNEGGFHGDRWYILLDAAALVSTSPLDLGSVKPDFVTLSFYKMFGFPTGLGALLVRNESSHLLKKSYFGGGTVAVSLPAQLYHVSRSSLSASLEDGTVSFLDIISLRHGFDALEKLAGGIKAISQYTFSLAQYFFSNLTSCCHGNGSPVAEVYTYGEYDDITKQGAIVNFNLKRANGDYIGFATVDSLAQLHNIHVRTGCFCNIGACQYFQHMTDEQVKENFAAGHVCGDNNDIIDGKPTGSVRVSFGYMSTFQDAQSCLQFIVDCFLENNTKPVFCEQKSVSQSSSSLTQSPGPSNQHRIPAMQCEDYKVPGENLTLNLTHSAIPSLKEMQGTTITEGLSKLGISVDEAETEHIETEDTGDQFTACAGKHLSEICLFPIKSCAAFKVERWPLGSRGLLYDREWMVVTESGIAMSQKREKMLCLIQPSIDRNRNVLKIDFPGMKQVKIPLEYEETPEKEIKLCNSRVCGDRVQSIDCGDTVAEWLSTALKRPGCRLIRQKSDDKRTYNMKMAKDKDGQDKSVTEGGRLSLANVSQYLLISKDSTISLHKRMCEANSVSLENVSDTGNQSGSASQENQSDVELFGVDNMLDRFRGNLVVSGCEPFEEDGWHSVQIGNIKFTSQGLCTRCQMICMDQKTGHKSTEPLKTLQLWRERKVTFGTLFCIDTDWIRPEMELKVGDPVFPEVRQDSA